MAPRSVAQSVAVRREMALHIIRSGARSVADVARENRARAPADARVEGESASRSSRALLPDWFAAVLAQLDAESHPRDAAAIAAALTAGGVRSQVDLVGLSAAELCSIWPALAGAPERFLVAIAAPNAKRTRRSAEGVPVTRRLPSARGAAQSAPQQLGSMPVAAAVPAQQLSAAQLAALDVLAAARRDERAPAAEVLASVLRTLAGCSLSVLLRGSKDCLDCAGVLRLSS